MALIRTAAHLLAVGTLLVLGSACSAELGDEGAPDELAGESSEEALRSSQSNTVFSATARTDSFIKVSTADSGKLASTEKCAIEKGEVLKLQGATIVGDHVRGLLMSAHGCAGKFGGGATVFAFREHYTWPAGLPSNADEEDGDEPTTSSGSTKAGPCAGTAFDRAVACALRKGARVLSYYRSPVDQERVRRQNGCTNRCTGMAGCVLPTAGCNSSPHTTCRAVDLINDGAPVSRAGLRACGLAKTSLPHVNHYDFVN